MHIVVDDLTGGEVIALLQEHMLDMAGTAPEQSNHALDIEALKAPNITFYSCFEHGQLLGCAAIMQLDDTHCELKSMRTVNFARNRGVASLLLKHLLNVAKSRGYSKISLETGSHPFFKPACKLYENFGFNYCPPFANYELDPHSLFMSLTID